MGDRQTIWEPSTLFDGCGRRIYYLRMSVTDRCNLRCTYCMPPEGIKHFNKNQILTFEELERFGRVAVGLGVRKIKLTGGEPLVRRGLVNFVASLKNIEGLNDLSLTTNGTYLEHYAYGLKKSGLDRVNVSLDSLDAKRYGEITRGGDLDMVLRGIDKALSLELGVKVNTVVLKGLDDKEVFNLIEFGREKGIEVRFIEFMPLCGTGWRREYFSPMAHLLNKIKSNYNLTHINNDGVGNRHSIKGGGIIGFITPLSEPFCSNCTRLRLTARGALRPCLFSSLETNIFTLLRNGASDEEIEREIIDAVRIKPSWNPVLAGVENPEKVFIRNIGG